MGLAVFVAFSVFLFGLFAGMLLIYLTEVRPAKKALNEALENSQPTINIDGGQNITHVHVPKREVKYGEIPINSYNTDNFVMNDDGYMEYYDEDGNRISHLGIDVSYHQTEIDWDKLKQSPCEFVMIRCGFRGYTEGGLKEDEKFREYADAAVEAGFPIGVYFFTQATSREEAVEEADFVLSLVKDYPLSYPIALDCEYVSDSNARTNLIEMTKEERTEYALTFCERIKENGYYPIIYASENWLRRSLDATMLQEYEIWAPQYLDQNDFMYDFTIWQYTDAGSMPGVKGNVDINISMVDYASFVPKLREAYTGDGEITEEE